MSEDGLGERDEAAAGREDGRAVEGQDLGEFVRWMVQAVVDRPDEVRVSVDEEEGARTYFVRVCPSDVGQAIGKDGRIAEAMRVLLGAAAKRQRRRATMRVEADDGAGPGER